MKSFFDKSIASTALFCILFVACTVTKPVKTGEMAFQVKQYAKAIELLENEYKQSKNDAVKARKAFLLGKSHDILQSFGESLKWFDIADQFYKTESSQLDLAYALKKTERYKDAQSLFVDLYKSTRDQKYKNEADICAQAIKNLKQVKNFEIESFTSNTKFSEYSPAFFENDFLVFSSDRREDNDKVYEWSGNGFSDLYVLNMRGRQVRNFDALINTDANEGTVCFSQDYNEIFFTRCYSTEQRDQYCKIYYSQRPNGFWLEPEALMFFNDKINFAHPTLFEQDSVLIFSAAPDGKNYDLYYSVRVEKGWTEAELMPSYINSEGDEKFPTAYKDTLYFASNGHSGYGGLDIFKTYLNQDGSWARPQNMGIPINSGADDFGLSINPSFNATPALEMQGFFSSSRNTGAGDDIFFFSKYPKEPEEVEEEEEIVVEVENDYLINLVGRVVAISYEDDDPNKAIINKTTLSDAEVKVTYGNETISLRTDISGRFIKQINAQNRHTLTTKKLGYLTNQLTVNIPDITTLDRDTTINVEIAMDPIIYNKEIIIPNIYYDFEKWNIREDAEAPLDSLVTLLDLNGNLDIELGSHTDCRGEELFNQDLSQKRAQSVLDYLATKGIKAERLSAKGYGESEPFDNCICNNCSEDQHQLNRRTTFKIIQSE